MSHPPRSNRGYRERTGDYRDRNGDHRERNGDHRERNGDHRQPRDDRHSSSDRSSSRPPYYPHEADYPPKHSREVPRVEHHESKCTNACSRRAQMVTSGLSSMAGAGGFNINSQFNLQGTELQQVRDLDMQYSQMRAPGVYGGIAFSLTFGVISLLFVVAGTKPPHVMSQKLLYGALVFQAVGAVVYVVAVGLYLHFVIGINSTDVCKQRERIYARNGYTWMNCDVGGADAAVALFGLITAILYTAGTVLTVQTIRGVKRYLQERKRREADRLQARPHAHRADTTAV
ncbi:MARVEL domain-containing protein 3 isoform X2 [Amphiprion ocellaris]|uniref:MARVEL domain-containing protein n=1 Tax=Amphiprion ocellaris TaxID=80972 RepID=A0AAQ5Y2R2_AMPOC|nr:MARVEL domain-containing protein 3 isoform X2 [Amphiprion ocellaris]